MKRKPFNEQQMRKFKDLNEALKVYSEQGIPNKEIVNLFNKSFELVFLNVALNVNFIQSKEGIKFLKSIIGNSEAREKAFQNALNEWKNKFQSQETEVKKRKKPIED